jgi:hypothetical protein
VGGVSIGLAIRTTPTTSYVDSHFFFRQNQRSLLVIRGGVFFRYVLPAISFPNIHLRRCRAYDDVHASEANTLLAVCWSHLFKFLIVTVGGICGCFMPFGSIIASLAVVACCSNESFGGVVG